MSLAWCGMTDGQSCWTLWSCMELKQTVDWKERRVPKLAAKGRFSYLISEAPRLLWGGLVFRSPRWAKHSITASLPPGLLWENVKNRTPHFTDSHIKRCQVQPRESSTGGWAAPVEQQEFKRLAEHKSLSEQCNMFILTTPAESESQTWKTCIAIPSAVMALWDKTPYRKELTWNDAGFSLFFFFFAHL